MDTIAELIEQLPKFGCIHIECNQEKSGEILAFMMERERSGTAFVTREDKGYERQSVREYLNFFRDMFGCEKTVESVMEEFALTDLRRVKMRNLKPGDYVKVGIARASMQPAKEYFLEDPLINLSEADMKRILRWMERRQEEGARFLTTNVSLRYALLMPGTSFYIEDGCIKEVEQEEASKEKEEEELEILKIPARSGNSTLLFEPKDVDYIESLNKCTYLSVRGTHFQTQQTMYELEETLKKSGFFRCHRSYLVNVQKVERFEKWTKNSYVLILNNQDHSQIPLSKGRIQEMKETFHW
ncbi:MAG: LytR family transcriptional regulator [Coprococcus sp.]|nr:LytR family transcriptional regulator [Coprococcus sp.]